MTRYAHDFNVSTNSFGVRKFMSKLYFIGCLRWGPYFRKGGGYHADDDFVVSISKVISRLYFTFYIHTFLLDFLYELVGLT